MFSVNHKALGMATVSCVRKIVTALGFYFALYIIGYFVNPIIDSAIGETRTVTFAMSLFGYPLIGLVVGFFIVMILGAPIVFYKHEYDKAKENGNV